MLTKLNKIFLLIFCAFSLSSCYCKYLEIGNAFEMNQSIGKSIDYLKTIRSMRGRHPISKKMLTNGNMEYVYILRQSTKGEHCKILYEVELKNETIVDWDIEGDIDACNFTCLVK